MELDVVVQHEEGHEYHHKAQGLRHPDGLATDGPVEEIQAVGPQALDPEAANAVPQEVEPGVLTVEAAGLGYHEDDEQQAHQIPQALIQERGVDLHQLAGDGGQLHPPGQGGLGTEGLPVHEVAPPADALADEQAHHRKVKHGTQLIAPVTADADAHDDHGDDGAVDGKAAVPDGNGLAEAEAAVAVFELIQIEQHIVNSCPHDGAGDTPQNAVQQVVLGDAVLGFLVHAPPDGDDQTKGDEDTVPVDAVADVQRLGAGGKGPVPEQAGEPDGAVSHNLHDDSSLG